jgi:hypothetical protein
MAIFTWQLTSINGLRVRAMVLLQIIWREYFEIVRVMLVLIKHKREHRQCFGTTKQWNWGLITFADYIHRLNRSSCQE